MKKLLVVCLIFAFMLPAFADSDKEEDRVKESGDVLKEILNIPDDIPQDLLDKAECIVVSALSEKRRLRRWRQLRARRHDLPRRTALHGRMGTTGSLRS